MVTAELRNKVARWLNDEDVLRRQLKKAGPRLIKSNMRDGISLREQARLCECSAAYLSKVLNGEDVISPLIYVILFDETVNKISVHV
jgi:hypothetical protein